MNKSIDTKKVMLDHSRAKVELYGRYLSIYLNMLSHVPSVDRIYIFDLMCGEGVYQDGAKGSPIVALDAVKNHYYSHNQTCPRITIWFNDNGLSEIEEGAFKVERVKRLCSAVYRPDNVDLVFCTNDFQDIHLQAIRAMQLSRRAKGLFFIDPYGYKDVKPHHIREILASGDTEVILFLPASHMYRFAEKSVQEEFPGSKPLREFLAELFKGEQPTFSSVYDFIKQVKARFRKYSGENQVFVDTFTMARSGGNVYCLFFFTSHVRGFEKMLETKWKLDSSQGQGFRSEQSLPLFEGVDGSTYHHMLSRYFQGVPYRTNEELYLFGLDMGYLPKHTKEVLQTWKQEGRIRVFDLDSSDRPVRGFYISRNPDRRIGIEMVS